MPGHYGMKKDKKKKRMGMKDGTKNMPRYGMNDGGPAVMASMEVQKPN